MIEFAFGKWRCFVLTKPCLWWFGFDTNREAVENEHIRWWVRLWFVELGRMQ